MNNKPNPYSVMRQSGGAVGSTVTGVILIIVVLFMIYYLYNWIMSGDRAYETTTILSGYAVMGSNIPSSTTGATSDPATGGSGSGCAASAAITKREANKILDGGQYAVTFWVYVSSTRDFLTAGSAPLAHLLEISDGASTETNRVGNTMLFVGLNPKNGGLIVRQNTTDGGERIDNTLRTYQNGSYPLSALISGYNQETNYTARDKCDIPNGIEYQRWVCIGVVGNGRTLDVYIDGKLARSCVYKANWALGNREGKAKIMLGLGNGGKLKGFFSNANYYSWALSPEEMWRTYQNGPGGPFSIWNWLKQYFSVTVDINNKALSEMSPCAACANTG
jgi:hypothetical protein